MKRVTLIIAIVLTSVSLYSQSVFKQGISIPVPSKYKTKVLNTTLTSVNKITSTVAQASDTSAVNLQFTITGSPELKVIGKTGLPILWVDSVNIGIGTTTPQHRLDGILSSATNLNAFNFTNSDINKNRLSITQTRDTSSVNLWMTPTGSPLLTLVDKNGVVIFRADSIGFGFGTATPFTKVSVLTNAASNLNAFNFTNSDVNKTRTTFATATDTSSVNLSYTQTGSPTFRIIGKTGNTILSADSIKIYTNVALTMAVDTCLGGQTKSVVGIGLLMCTNTCTLYGLSGGVTGQILNILNTNTTTLTIKHNSTGTQKFMIAGGTDLSLSAQYRSVSCVFDGTNWYITGKNF